MRKAAVFLSVVLICLSFAACGRQAYIKFIPMNTASAAPQATEMQQYSIPTEKPEPSLPEYAELSLGDENESVVLLQARLSELGYMREEATGYFGLATQRAVDLFKRQMNLPEDGIADIRMQTLIFGSSASKCVFPLAGYIIGIDPGHQKRGDADLEPVYPGFSKMKKKVSSGTQGRFSGVPEYEVNLAVGLILQDMLDESGATVVMTRETNDVNISNIERAQLFNENKTDYAVRLHCNGSENQGISGAFILIPSDNPNQNDCKRGAELLIDEYCKATGAVDLGIVERSDQTCFNWCERMIINIEMGHMTNKSEDMLLTSPEYQQSMAKGIYNGILAYFD